jgi:WD40 repeat protein
LCGIPYGGEMAAVVWDIESSRQLWKWMPKTAPIGRPAITAPGWAADSRTVAFAYENTAIVIDAASGKVIAELTGHTSPIRQIAFDPDGKRLWSGADHDVVRNWDWAQGKQLGSVKASANYGVFRFEAGHHELIQLSGTSLLRHNLDQK